MASIDLQSSKEHSNQQAFEGDNLPHVRYLSWGIFKIAYEVSPRPWISFLKPSALAQYREPFRFFLRFLRELWRLDCRRTLEFYLYTLWLSLSPALALILASLVIFNMENDFKRESGEVKENALRFTQRLVLIWLFCGLMSHCAERNMTKLRAKLGGSLRAHFLPKLVRAHLDWNPNDLENVPDVFPYPSDFGDFIPGWDFLTGSFDKLRHVTIVTSQTLVLAVIIPILSHGHEAYFFLGLILLFVLVSFCLPINGAGGGGYTFWTKNLDFNRLMRLFNIVFDRKYRSSLLKDGVTDYLMKEYDDASEALGAVESDVWSVGWFLPPPWYWGVVQSWIMKDPAALCALFVPLAHSSSITGIILIVQYAIFNMRDSVDVLKHTRSQESLLNLWKKAETFYLILDKAYMTTNGHKSLDLPMAKYGCEKITLIDVSYKYPNSSRAAVCNVNLTIEPGQIVVVTGSRGSGKSTLVKLLCGILEPTSGEVLLDGDYISIYDSDQRRRQTTFIGQAEVIYPLSLRENILFGLPDTCDYNVSNEDQRLERATGLAGCSSLFGEYRDVILNPCSIPSYSFEQTPGKGAIKALEMETADAKGRWLSSAESQSVFAARGFLKAQYRKTNLIVLDDPFNSLDAMTMHSIFDNFQKIARETGQTIVIVTTQLASVANADKIFCLNDGKLEEQGLHGDLVTLGGKLSALSKRHP